MLQFWKDSGKWKRLIPLMVAASTIGCAQKTITCQDEAAIGIVKGIYTDALAEGVRLRGGDDALVGRVNALTSIEVASIRTVGIEEKIGIATCEAQLVVRLPKEAAEGLQNLSVIIGRRTEFVSGDHIESTIQYTAQFTDDRKEISVRARGVKEVGSFMAMVASSGLLKAPEAAPPIAQLTGGAKFDPGGATRADPETLATDRSAPAVTAPIDKPAVSEMPVAATEASVLVSGSKLVSSPSFSCKGPLTQTEKLVCETPALADADTTLAKHYAAALNRATDSDALKEGQRDWRRERDACSDTTCIAEAYERRSAELASVGR